MKKIITMLLVASLLVFPVMTAFANEYSAAGSVEWDGKDFTKTSDNIDKVIGDMQPGDKVVYTVKLTNTDSVDTDFWLSNKILDSFENNGTASDGAYTYILEFNGPDGSETFYDSATVGGEADNGLYGVENSIDKDAYFVLGTLSKGESGTVTLTVILDGETQGNGYQKADASLELIFGAEPRTMTTNKVTKKVTKTVTATTNDVKTGDTNMAPFSIVAIIAGVLLIVVATSRRKKAVRG